MSEVLMLAVALAMDSMAMSIVNGIRYKNYGPKQMFEASFSFSPGVSTEPSDGMTGSSLPEPDPSAGSLTSG